MANWRRSCRCRSAQKLDPLSSTVESDYGRVLFRARQYNEAAQHFQRAIELDGQDESAYTRLAAAYEQTGRAREAIPLLEQAFHIRGGLASQAALAREYALLGRRAEAHDILRSVTKQGSAGVSVSLIYFALGDRDHGFEWHNKAFDQREMVHLVGIDPRFDDVSSDPRFEALVRRLGLPGRH